MSEPRLITTWDHAAKRHRLIELGQDHYSVERCDRSAPGAELWTPIFDTNDSPLRDGGNHARVVRALISGIREFAAQRASYSKTFDYSTGKGT